MPAWLLKTKLPVLTIRQFTALTSDCPDDAFFIFEYLLQKFHISTSETPKEAVPGAVYIKNVKKFSEMHYARGELFMKFIRQLY